MKVLNRPFLLAVTGILVAAAPSAAQLWFFPDYAVPSATGDPATWVSGSWGRGLNDASGKVNALGVSVGRTGEKVSVMGGIGRASEDGESETTLGGAVGVDVVRSGSAIVSVQGGVGWFSFDGFSDGVTALRFPIGVALKGSVETASATFTPWVMPRLNYVRLSAGGESESSTDPGASGGFAVTFPGGFGLHMALDVLFREGDDSIGLGIGAHYVIGGGRS